MSKLQDNFGLSALRMLGPTLHARMLFTALMQAPAIAKARDLSPLDRAMSHNMRVKHRFGAVTVNAQDIDRMVPEQGSYTFGQVRELYLRDCYFRLHPSLKPGDIRTVIDLGGNRGLFSTLCTPFCEQIAIVEVQPHYNDVIRYNIQTVNGFSNFSLVNAFIGSAGKFEEGLDAHISFAELLRQVNMESGTIDFMKVDIEGGEFTLFQEPLPFERIKYISMEVHPTYGDVNQLIATLKQYRFAVKTVTAEFTPTNDPQLIEFVYARNPALTHS